MKMRSIVLILALCAAAWLAFFADKTPTGGIAEPIARTASAKNVARTARSPIASHGAEHDIAILALHERDNLIDAVDTTMPIHELFQIQNWAPPPPPPPKPPPPPPPTAPPLPFTYLGKKIEDSQWEAYLAQGDQILVVREQSIIDNLYRIDAITPPTLTVTYLPLNQRQTLTIGGID